MSAFRLVGEVDGRSRVFVLTAEVCTVGSHRSNDLVLDVPGASRRHAVLRIEPDGLVVEDRGSKNGTWINGHRTAMGRLLPGDELAVGNARLRLESAHPEDGEVALLFGDPPSEIGSRVDSEPWETALLDDVSTLAEPILAWLDEVLLRFAIGGAEALHDGLEEIRVRLGARAAAVVVRRATRDLGIEAMTAKPDLLAHEIVHDALARHERALGRAADLALGEGKWRSEDLREGILGVTPLPEGEVLFLVLLGGVDGDSVGNPLFRLLGTMLAVALGIGNPVDRPRSHGGLRFPAGHVAGRSPAILRLYSEMEAAAGADYPALILGETGVGKEMLSQTLHRSSARASEPFVVVNCAAIPADLLEAEMFGVVRGAATGVSARPGCFERADGGTLFLDEVGELHAELQAKLLRALEYGEIQPVGGGSKKVDVRVVAATNVDLEKRIEEGAFRADLFYRLAACVLDAPPLRQRREDLPLLITHFVQRFADERGIRIRGLTRHALDYLLAYAWPGNVRELQHELRRMVQRATPGQVLDSSLLGEKIRTAQPEEEDPASGETRELAVRDGANGQSLDLKARVAEVERQVIGEALRRTEGNRTVAAQVLGISRNTLATKIALYGLDRASVP